MQQTEYEGLGIMLPIYIGLPCMHWILQSPTGAVKMFSIQCNMLDTYSADVYSIRKTQCRCLQYSVQHARNSADVYSIQYMLEIVQMLTVFSTC